MILRFRYQWFSKGKAISSCDKGIKTYFSSMIIFIGTWTPWRICSGSAKRRDKGYYPACPKGSHSRKHACLHFALRYSLNWPKLWCFSRKKINTNLQPPLSGFEPNKGKQIENNIWYASQLIYCFTVNIITVGCAPWSLL